VRLPYRRPLAPKTSPSWWQLEWDGSRDSGIGKSPADLKLLDSSSTGRLPAAHQIWFNAARNRYTTVPNHTGDMPEGTLRAILRQAGMEPGEFLELS
jgi:HicA toxin of bacterial toxin-antitoxin,